MAGVGVYRVAAHMAFDDLWKRRKMTRKQAYAWLAAKLHIPKEECHMKLFDEEQCKRVIEICGPLAFEKLDEV